MSEATVGMLQGPSTNCFAALGRMATPARTNPITQEVIFSVNGLSILVDKNMTKDICFSVALQKLFDYLIICFSEQNDYRSTGILNREIQIELKKYASLLGIAHTYQITDEIARNLQLLCNITIEYESVLGRTHVLESAEIKNRRIYATFAETFARHLNSLYIMQFPLSLLSTKARNPNTYYLGRKIALHHSIKNNQKRGTESVLTVKSLIAASPNLPSIEEIRLKNRQYTQLIRRPFEGALDALVASEVLENWYYCPQYSRILIHGAGDFSDFMDAKITYKLCD